MKGLKHALLHVSILIIGNCQDVLFTILAVIPARFTGMKIVSEGSFTLPLSLPRSFMAPWAIVFRCAEPRQDLPQRHRSVKLEAFAFRVPEILNRGMQGILQIGRPVLAGAAGI